GRSPAAASRERPAGRAGRAPGSGRPPAEPGKSHAERAVCTGRPGPGRGSGRAAGARHHFDHDGHHPGAAGADRVQLAADRDPGRGGRDRPGAGRGRHPAPPARSRRRAAHRGGDMRRGLRLARAENAATYALGLLVLVLVFVALAGPAQSLRVQTQALRQQLATLSPVDKTVDVSSDWTTLTGVLNYGPDG